MAFIALRALVRKDLLLFFGDRRAVLMGFIAPIAIASFFGSIFGGNGGNSEPARIPVAIVDEDAGTVSRAVVAGAQADRTLRLTTPRRDEARAGVRSGAIAVAVVIPKGFCPVQDTGVLLGISEAPQSISFPAMVDRQQALAAAILKDPAVASLSSFIGIDGINTTLNSGRLQINLKPFEERRDSAQQILVRLQRAVGDVNGIALFLQPMQDLTVEDRISRTQ